jgi:methionyl-tRNA formyltransferase
MHSALIHPVRKMWNNQPDNDLEIYGRFNGSLVYLPRHFNHQRSVQTIGEWDLDLLLNAAGPIYRKKLIEGCGATILNCHMGILPEVRGTNVGEWSVYLGYPVGNTVHIIDSGIDTGKIIAFFHQDTAGIGDIDSLRRHMFSLNAVHLASIVDEYAQGKREFLSQSATSGRQYYRMHPRLKELVNEKLKTGYSPIHDLRDRSYFREYAG